MTEDFYSEISLDAILRKVEHICVMFINRLTQRLTHIFIMHKIII